MNDLKNTQGLENTQDQLFENRITDLENAFQSLAKDFDASRVFQDGLEQRLRQIERRLDVLSSFPRATESRLSVCGEGEECWRRIAAIERRLDILEPRNRGVSDMSRRPFHLSMGISPANGTFVHERGPLTVGRRPFPRVTKRQRHDGEGQSTGQDGDWLIGSQADLFDHVRFGSERLRGDRVPFSTTLPPRARSLDLQ